jgi:hypothetical protein
MRLLTAAFLLVTSLHAQSQAVMGSTNTGNFTITGTNTANFFQTLPTTNNVGTVHYFMNSMAGTYRWGLSTANAENGTNLVGSDFALSGYDNTGTYIGQYMFVNRSTGYTAIGKESATAPAGWLQIRALANDPVSTLLLGFPVDPGTLNVPLGGVSGGYNIDFYTYRDVDNNEIGARIRAERLNAYAASNALVQSMDLAFSTSDGGGPADLTERMRIKSSGFVGIGTANPQSLLAVKGTITSEQVNVTMTGWSDFVFNKGYQLPNLDSVAQYASINGHLPGIPSEDQLKKDGLDLGNMQKLQMQKVEELTLYQAEAEKKIKALEDENAALKQSLEELKAAVRGLQAARN